MSGPVRGDQLVPSADAAVYVISVAAELSGLHPQTLRSYERMGLIMPGRTGGGGRRYSLRDIELLREIATLTAGGVGIEGVRRILELEDQVTALQARAAELQRELAATRDALTAAMAASAGGSVPTDPSGGRPAPNKLPVLRAPGPGSALVVWRRTRDQPQSIQKERRRNTDR